MVVPGLFLVYVHKDELLNIPASMSLFLLTGTLFQRVENKAGTVSPHSSLNSTELLRTGVCNRKADIWDS